MVQSSHSLYDTALEKQFTVLPLFDLKVSYVCFFYFLSNIIMICVIAVYVIFSNAIVILCNKVYIIKANKDLVYPTQDAQLMF